MCYKTLETTAFHRSVYCWILVFCFSVEQALKENRRKQLCSICVTDPGPLFCMPMLPAEFFQRYSGNMGCEGHS